MVSEISACRLGVLDEAKVNANAYEAIMADGLDNPLARSFWAASGHIGGYLGGMFNGLFASGESAPCVAQPTELGLLRREAARVIDNTTALTPGSAQFGHEVDEYVRTERKKRGL